jgi:hypothetical protein
MAAFEVERISDRGALSSSNGSGDQVLNLFSRFNRGLRSGADKIIN